MNRHELIGMTAQNAAINNSIAPGVLLQTVVALSAMVACAAQDRTNAPLPRRVVALECFLSEWHKFSYFIAWRNPRITCESRLNCSFVFESRTDSDLFALPWMA